MTHPLLDHALIKARLDAVTEIMDSMSSVGVSMEEAWTFSWSRWDSGHTGALSRHQQNLGQHGLLPSLLMSLGKLPNVQRGITRIFLRTATAAEVRLLMLDSTLCYFVSLSVKNGVLGFAPKPSFLFCSLLQ